MITFKEHKGVLKYKNPFGKNPAPATFERVNPKIFKRLTGVIVKVHASQYDYLVNGELITQRCGASEKILSQLIAYEVKPGDYDLQFKLNKGEIKDI